MGNYWGMSSPRIGLVHCKLTGRITAKYAIIDDEPDVVRGCAKPNVEDAKKDPIALEPVAGGRLSTLFSSSFVSFICLVLVAATSQGLSVTNMILLLISTLWVPMIQRKMSSALEKWHRSYARGQTHKWQRVLIVTVPVIQKTKTWRNRNPS